MAAPLWIVSSREPLRDNLAAWFASLETRRREVLPSCPVFLELCTQRAGCRGMLEDNPPLEKVDDLRMAAEERGWSFGSIFLPIRLDQTDEAMGMEISSVNGWIDLASYLVIPLARVRLMSPTLQHPQAREVVSTLLRYMQESDLRISVSSEEPLPPAWLNWLQSLNAGNAPSLGLDVSANPSSREVPFLPEGHELPVSTLRLPPDTLRQNPPEAFLSSLGAALPDSPPAIVVELPGIEES